MPERQDPSSQLPTEGAGNPGWLRRITRYFRRSTEVLDPVEADPMPLMPVPDEGPEDAAKDRV
jgi:hypothetical protein